MENRSTQDLKQFVASLTEKLAQAEKFFTIKLATRLTKAAERFPQDQTIIQMANFLNSRANSQNGHLISRNELNEVYNKLYTTNTKCASLLEEELGKKADKLPEPAKMTRSVHEGETIDDMYSRHADKMLTNQLTAAFNGGKGFKQYDEDIAARAIKSVASKLPGNPKIEVVDGRDFAILCRATYETPKGRSGVIVPVEVVNSAVIPPNCFLSQAGFRELNNKDLEDHIVSTAGNKYRLDSEQIFSVIKTAKFGPEKKMDPVDLAVMKLRARTADNHTINGIVYQKVDEVVEDVKTESKEASTFSDRLGSTAGSAEFLFGEKAVKMSRSLVENQLKTFGFANAQLKISNVKSDALIFSVAVGGAGFKVPVKIASGKPQQPSMVIAAGNIEEFSKDGIRNALGFKDQHSSASAMGYDLTKPTELINEVKSACYDGDLNKARSIITIMEKSDDKRAFAYAFSLYTSALDGTLKKEAKREIKTVKIGGNEVCAQTFLPVDKVYMDDKGVCHAKYRDNIENTDDNFAAGFMNAKIIMGL